MRFLYNICYSVRDFFIKFVNYEFIWKIYFSDEIKNEGWFLMEWSNDFMVRGMFIMFDEI